ncbi:hypothetical protein GCAAIG_08160 [Candidatus Electronema halotolerans]
MRGQQGRSAAAENSCSQAGDWEGDAEEMMSRTVLQLITLRQKTNAAG